MTTRAVSHGMFTVERRYAAAPARVFRAWAEPEQIRQWAAPAEGWFFRIAAFDFRVGGSAVMEFGPQGDVLYTDSTRYDDILPDQRIVSAYAITKGGVRISSSVSSLEFLADGAGTLLRVTEVGAFLDGLDSAKGREGGVLQQVEQLAQFLAQG